MSYTINGEEKEVDADGYLLERISATRPCRSSLPPKASR